MMKNRLVTGLLILAVCAALLGVANVRYGDRGSLVAPAYAQGQVTARQGVFGGQAVGEVLANGDVLFRIRTSAGGLSPFQRAQIIAERLNNMMGDTLQPEDITTGRVRGMDVVLARGQVIATADPAHARINNTTPMALADVWAVRVENFVAGRPVAETPVGERIVPIISVGRGIRVGGAAVTGAQAQVNQVRAVAQIEGQFGDAVRVRVLVPVSSEDVIREIRRVPQTSVTGLVDIGL